MFSKVRVKKGALNHFRKLAREAYPLEIQAYLAGTITSLDTVEITDFLYTSKYKLQNNNEVAWDDDEFHKVKDKIENEGKRILGDIHTHPNWDAVLSETDYESSVTQQLVICGICSVDKGKKTRVRFWTPTSCLHCKIIYI